MDRCARWHISDPSGREGGIPAAGAWYYNCARSSDATMCHPNSGTVNSRGTALTDSDPASTLRSWCCINSADGSVLCNDPSADVEDGLALQTGVIGWEYRQKPSWGNEITGCASDVTQATPVAPLLSVRALAALARFASSLTALAGSFPQISPANMGQCQPKPGSSTMNLWLGQQKDLQPHPSWQAHCVVCELGLGRVGDRCAQTTNACAAAVVALLTCNHA